MTNLFLASVSVRPQILTANLTARSNIQDQNDETGINDSKASLAHLANEILINIIRYLPIADQIECVRVSRHFARICSKVLSHNLLLSSELCLSKWGACTKSESKETGKRRLPTEIEVIQTANYRYKQRLIQDTKKYAAKYTERTPSQIEEGLKLWEELRHRKETGQLISYPDFIKQLISAEIIDYHMGNILCQNICDSDPSKKQKAVQVCQWLSNCNNFLFFLRYAPSLAVQAVPFLLHQIIHGEAWEIAHAMLRDDIGIDLKITAPDASSFTAFDYLNDYFSRPRRVSTAINEVDVELVRCYLSNNGGINKPVFSIERLLLWTPLYWAAYRGRVNLVRYLIERGAAIDLPCAGKTPLFAAVMQGRLNVVKLLIAESAQSIDAPSQTNSGLMTPMRWMLTRIHTVSDNKIQGFLEIAQFLLEQGAHIPQQDQPSFMQFLCDAPRIVDTNSLIKLVLSQGFPINAHFHEPPYPLDWAAHRGAVERVKCLMQVGGEKMQLSKRTIGELIQKAFTSGQASLEDAKNYLTVSNLLLQRGYSVQGLFTADEAFNPLYLICKIADKNLQEYALPIIKQLINRLHTKDTGEIKINGSSNLLLLLLQRARTVDTIDAHELVALAEHLLKKGVFTGKPIDEGLRCYLLQQVCMLSRTVNVHSFIQCLVERGVNFEIDEFAGTGPLDCAAMQCAFRRVEYLLQISNNKISLSDKTIRALIRAGHRISEEIKERDGSSEPENQLTETQIKEGKEKIKNWFKMAELLLSKGYRVNEDVGKGKKTALYLACEVRGIEPEYTVPVIKQLIKQEGISNDVAQKSLFSLLDAETANALSEEIGHDLHWALKESELVKLFVFYREVNQQNSDGDTLLHLWAALEAKGDEAKQRKEKIKELLFSEPKIEVNIKNNAGLTPLDVAKTKVNQSAIRQQGGLYSWELNFINRIKRFMQQIFEFTIRVPYRSVVSLIEQLYRILSAPF